MLINQFIRKPLLGHCPVKILLFLGSGVLQRRSPSRTGTKPVLWYLPSRPDYGRVRSDNDGPHIPFCSLDDATPRSLRNGLGVLKLSCKHERAVSGAFYCQPEGKGLFRSWRFPFRHQSHPRSCHQYPHRNRFLHHREHPCH